MTCIVGLVHRDGVLIGADSAGLSANWDLTVRRDRKVFQRDGYVIGFTTSFRMGQLIAHGMALPQPPRRARDLDHFMVIDFVDALRAELRRGGWAKSDAGQELGGDFLVGVRRRLFRIGSDFQVGESAGGLDAVGCGAPLAMGALFATEGIQTSPDRRVLTALRAAARGSAGVCGPFHLVRSAR